MLLLLPSLWCAPALAAPPIQRAGLLPQVEHRVGALQLSLDGGPWQSEVQTWEEGGSRVGVLLQAPPGAELWIEARAVDEADVYGPWLPLEETWRGGDAHRVFAGALEDWSPSAQLRVWGLEGLDPEDRLAWELIDQEPEPRSSAAPPPAPAVSAALEAIGVVPRETWGASATTCTSTEDDWYRFAIHHTAGNQTSGGTVQGAVQALQAYALGTGTYCDIPYQFLVGYDGSLWEGRPLTYTSGATGGGNNDGNMALCFLGCYDADGCSTYGAEETLAMLAAARLLAQTLATQEATTADSSTLQGHKDYPGNSTACPGDLVYPHLDELRSTTAHFQGALVGTAWSEDTVVLEVGETAVGWVDIANVGLESWTANTVLAPLPRDTASALAAETWISSSRISTPEADTAPGQTARFPVELVGTEPGASTLSMALVEEWVTWFPDIPIGGGPAEGEILLRVEVVEPGALDTGDTGGGGVGGGGAEGGGGTGEQKGQVIRPAAEEERGCGCGGGGAGAWLVLGALGWRRRQR